MLGYLFIGLALLSGIIKGYCGKKSGNKIEHLMVRSSVEQRGAQKTLVIEI